MQFKDRLPEFPETSGGKEDKTRKVIETGMKLEQKEYQVSLPWTQDGRGNVLFLLLIVFI